MPSRYKIQSTGVSQGICITQHRESTGQIPAAVKERNGLVTSTSCSIVLEKIQHGDHTGWLENAMHFREKSPQENRAPCKVDPTHSNNWMSPPRGTEDDKSYNSPGFERFHRVSLGLKCCFLGILRNKQQLLQASGMLSPRCSN